MCHVLNWLSPASRSTRGFTDLSTILMSDMGTSCCLANGFLKMTERQADALLRSDLRKLCTMFRGFGRDSLLLATLAYNVGCGKVMKSRMYAKMRSGNRNIYRDYVDFKRWNGKIVPSIERRRKMEYLLLFTP